MIFICFSPRLRNFFIKIDMNKAKINKNTNTLKK